ncbi:hypothetical protein Tco_1517493 [Tanacetum coccineum]
MITDYRDKEIEVIPFKDIDDLVPIPRVSEKPLDSLNLIFDHLVMTITNPLFDIDSDYTSNYENPIFECHYEEMYDDEHITFDTFDHVIINALFEIDFEYDATFVNPLFQNQ